MNVSNGTDEPRSLRFPREGFFDSDGVGLHYLDWGGTGPAIILLAGLGDTASIFRGLAPRLADRSRVLALTRRGHGRSDRPSTGYDLDTLVRDIVNFMDVLGIGKAIVAGASFAGIEMPCLALDYPTRVNGLIFLDAHFPRLDPEPDLSDDPLLLEQPTGPGARDLLSWEALVAFRKRARPNLARIWCAALEADLREKITIAPDQSVRYNQDNDLMKRIMQVTWSRRDPQYQKLKIPVLAIVPWGDCHPGLPLDASDEQRRLADEYWDKKIFPSIKQRTNVFKKMVPTARILKLDSPEHRIFIAKEEATIQAIKDFLESIEL